MLSEVMILKKMDLKKSSSQCPKSTLPSPNHEDFVTQRQLSMGLISFDSHSSPGRLSHPSDFMVLLKINFENRQVRLQKKHLINILKPYTDVPPLADFQIRISQS